MKRNIEDLLMGASGGREFGNIPLDEKPEKEP